MNDFKYAIEAKLGKMAENKAFFDAVACLYAKFTKLHHTRM